MKSFVFLLFVFYAVIIYLVIMSPVEKPEDFRLYHEGGS